MTVLTVGLDFELPDALVAKDPPEARGLARDGVKLLVSRVSEGRLWHARFSDLPCLLNAGDLLVVNASATLAASLDAERTDRGGEAVLLHLSTPLPDGRWVVELRRRTSAGHQPLLDAEPGERLVLPGGASARLVQAHAGTSTDRVHTVPVPATTAGRVRLWEAELTLPQDVPTYTARFGAPIRYGYVPRAWPLEHYQTVFSEEPGSAEMPSAARPFTRALLERLTRRGVGIQSIVLHTGVSSLDAGESPYPERYRVSVGAADAVNRTRARGGRVIAVGTTCVRAIETVASEDGRVRPGEGWTDVVVTAERGVRAVDGILTGLHGPNASHLSMLEAFAGPEHLSAAYDAALGHAYLWHEFGDSHLILP